MENSPRSFLERWRRNLGGWIIPLLLALGVIAVFASFAKGTSAADSAQAAATPTIVPMPGMVMPTSAPANSQPGNANDMDALLLKMQQMTQSLQGMMSQLDQKGIYVAPTATPIAAPAANMQAMMNELQDINRALVPLMQRIQADMQGNPSADELASVRAQVAQIQGRMVNLMNQLKAARNGTPMAAAPAATTMPGMGTMPSMTNTQVPPANQPDQSQAMASQTMMNKLDQLMQHMQGMLQQMQNQQQAGSLPGGNMTGGNMSGQMNGTNMATPTAAPSMSNSTSSMNGMMSMMNDMMSMMDNMMGGMPSQSGQMNGMNMATPTAMPGMNNMPQAAPMPGMSNSTQPMDSMMSMMDQMMMMMDNMMKTMDGMMGGSSMNNSGSGTMNGSGSMNGSSSGGGMMDGMDMMGMPDM